MLNPIKLFIRMFAHAKTFWHRLLNTDITEVKDVQPDTVKELIPSWCVEVLVYGSLLTLVLVSFVGWLGYRTLLLVPGLGILRWLVLDITRSVKEIFSNGGNV